MISLVVVIVVLLTTVVEDEASGVVVPDEVDSDAELELVAEGETEEPEADEADKLRFRRRR